MKKKLVLSILVLLMGSTLFITNNKKVNKEIAIEDLENNKSMAIYIKDDNGNYNKATNIPTSGYTLNTIKSVCTNNAKPSWNIKTNSLKISNLTSKDTGCYLYFDELNNLQIEMASAEPSPDGFTGIADTDEGMFYAEDDWGTTYYYRGAVEDNWFKFANLYWRIIRVNGDGSIRMIYNGATTDQTGETTQIGTSKYSHIDAKYNSATDHAYVKDNTYIGYMYGTEGTTSYSNTHSNATSNAIKNAVDSWYKTNIEDENFSKYVSKEVGFCNDRSIASSNETWLTIDTKKGYGTNATAYGPFSRILTTSSSWKTMQTPKFGCTNASSDLFTATGSSKGNKKLTYPVGLITADEVIFGGGFGGTANSSYYLYTNQDYWTMSPYIFNGSYASVFRVYSNGYTVNCYVYGTYGVRPVINISPDVKLIGDGTTSDPYKVEGVE